MTKLLKATKNNKGFTLVEVIVVAVIVLILAAVAIPLYNGYIRDSRQAALENITGSVASLAGTSAQVQGTIATVTGQRAFRITGGTFGDDAQVVIPERFTVVLDGAVGTVTARPCTAAGDPDDNLVANAPHIITVGTFTGTGTIPCMGTVP